MKTHESYHAYLIESLKDPLEAAAYLAAVFEDGDFEHISLALKSVAEARRGEDTNSDWEKCYQSLAQDGTIALSTIVSLLDQLGLKLSVTTHNKRAA